MKKKNRGSASGWRLMKALDVVMAEDAAADTYGTGPTDNWPLRGGKGQLYEGGLRVPLILRWDRGLEPTDALRARCRDLLIGGVDLMLAGVLSVGLYFHFSGRVGSSLRNRPARSRGAFDEL